MWRSRSLPFSGRWIVCAVVVVGVALVAVLTSGGTPASQQVNAGRVALPPASVLKQAARRERGVRDRGASVRAARRGSRLRHAGLGDREAAALARRTFSQQMRAPLFSGRDLGDGTRVVASRGPGRALVKDKHGKKALVVSSAALEARDGRDRMAAVDLSLERSRAGIAPVNSSVPFTIDPVSAARVRLTGLGVGMRVAGAQGSPGAGPLAAHSSSAQITNGRAFFANVHPDTDAGVVPLPGGFELFLMARSQRAPQRFSLALDLPAGASLRRAVSKPPVPAGAPRSIEVVKGDGTLGYVSSPVAHDADGRSVATRMSIEGQQIVLDVAHRGLDVRYPISIDPEMIFPSNHTIGFAGWTWGQTSAGGPWAGAIDNCAVYCGLFQWLPPYAQAPHGTGAVFAYHAPAKTAITRTTFGGVAHTPYRYAGTSFTHAYQGLLNSSPTFWERGRFANQDGLQPDTGYALAWPNSAAFWGHTNTVWTTQTPQEQNLAVVAIQAWHPWGNFPVGPTSSYAVTTMAWSQISISDTYPPKWHPQTAAPTDSGWTDDNNAWHNRSFRATDEGLGLYTLKLTGAASINAPPPAQGTVAGDTITAKCTGTPPNAVCPTDWPTTQVAYKLNEGTNTLTAQATDATGNTIPGPTRTWTEKIDRTPPRIDQLSGSLMAEPVQDGRRTLTEPGYELSILTSDPNPNGGRSSQVTRIEVLSDGIVVMSEPSCGETCPRTWTLDTGDPQYIGQTDLEVRVTDGAGHTTKQSIPVHVIPNDEKDSAIEDDTDAEYGDGLDDFCDPDSNPGPEGPYCSSDDESSPNARMAMAEPPVGQQRHSLAAGISPPLETLGHGWGVANDNPTIDGFFGDERFTRLGVKAVRRTIPWDVVVRTEGQRLYECTIGYQGKPEKGIIPKDVGSAQVGNSLADFDQWINRAHADGYEILLSINRTYDVARCYLPGEDEYVDAVRKIMERYKGKVIWYTAWNEPNHRGQPTSLTYRPGKTGITRAGRFWRRASALCKYNGRQCKVAAGEFTDDSRTWGSKAKIPAKEFFDAYMKGAGTNPTVWAWHAYYTGTTGKTGRMSAFLTRTRKLAGASPRIWLTEQGGRANIYRRRGQTKAESESNANKELVRQLDLRNLSDRITRIYTYHWRAGAEKPDPRKADHDSGLLRLNGDIRQMYCTLFTTYRQQQCPYPVTHPGPG